MDASSIPESIVARFRTLSLERVARIEAVWTSILEGVHEEAAVREMSRDLHTLKGDSCIVGYDDVHLLSQKLEDLLALARQNRYQVSEDFELVVTMATQFLSILLRKKSSTTSGIDLAGFVRQVDEVLRESRALNDGPRVNRGGKQRSDAALDRLSEPTRGKFAIAATAAFLEYLGARGGTSRTRLRGIWTTLRDELARMHATSLEAILERYAMAGRDLAASLGKQAVVELDLAEVRADSRVAEAIDIAVLHLIRNAIDHGIEAPAIREAANKPAHGTIRLCAREQAGQLKITVTDDGSGIDLAAVRAKGTKRNLIDQARAAVASENELLDLLFHPGFSTRDEVTELSGRGVGMDAVRTALLRVGGTVKISTELGRGSTITLLVPTGLRQVRAYQFLGPGGTVSLAVSARWTPSIDHTADTALDPISAIQLLGSSRQTSVDMSRPVEDLALRLRWGFLELSLRAATEPVLVTAERVCPTPDDYPVEVISIDGHETLMLRPEHVVDLNGAVR
jgi:two-component system chemotaxis sensor kinase CheA